MSKFILSITCLCLSFVCSGCDGQKKGPEKTVWENTRLSDLATTQPNPQAGIKKLNTINIQVQIYEIPSNSVDKLDDISKILTVQPLHFSRSNIFNANGFIAGFSRTSAGVQILELLKSAGGRNAAAISLLLEDGQTDYVPVLRLSSAKSIFYTALNGKTDSKTIGPGLLALRITAQKSPVFRGTYIITAVPAVPSIIGGVGSQVQSLAKLNDIVFDSCSFSLQFSPGDFFLLRPIKYAEHGNSLGSLFFSRPGIRPWGGMKDGTKRMRSRAKRARTSAAARTWPEWTGLNVRRRSRCAPSGSSRSRLGARRLQVPDFRRNSGRKRLQAFALDRRDREERELFRTASFLTASRRDLSSPRRSTLFATRICLRRASSGLKAAISFITTAKSSTGSRPVYGETSRMWTRTLVRSTCFRNRMPKPWPRWAPSMRPGMSATTKLWSEPQSTTPRFGMRVVNG